MIANIWRGWRPMARFRNVFQGVRDRCFSFFAAAIFVGGGIAGSPAHAQTLPGVTWTTSTHKPTTGANPRSIVVGDFNGDGIADIVVGQAGSIGVFLGNGDGTFKPADAANDGMTFQAPLSGTIAIAAAAFHSGKPDGIIVVSNTYNAIIFSNGTGGEMAPSPFSLTTSTTSVATGALTGSGNKSGPTTGKIKGIMHAVYEYGLFEEQATSNPCDGWRLKGVKSTYTAITITPQQTLMILRSVTDPLYFALVFTVAATALRASEVIALRWADIMWGESCIRVSKRWRKGKDGKPKTEASNSTVVLGPILAHYLCTWKGLSPYTSDTNFVFPSMVKRGVVPVCASVFDRNYLRPAAIEAGVSIPVGYRFGLHNLRHS